MFSTRKRFPGMIDMKSKRGARVSVMDFSTPLADLTGMRSFTQQYQGTMLSSACSGWDHFRAGCSARKRYVLGPVVPVAVALSMTAQPLYSGLAGSGFGQPARGW